MLWVIIIEWPYKGVYNEHPLYKFSWRNICCNKDNFQMKNSDLFLSFAINIAGRSWVHVRTASFTILKWGARGGLNYMGMLAL